MSYMISSTPNFSDRPLNPRWRWRDQKENFHQLSKMETKHLFYTLRMIWNHTMPEEVKLHPYNLYEFDDFYTVDYMADAILHIGSELFKRTDILPSWAKELNFMADVFSSRVMRFSHDI